MKFVFLTILFYERNSFFVFQACKEADVDYLIAPFEADAQLTYLINRGIVHFIVTEDSDLIAFGCKRVREFLSCI